MIEPNTDAFSRGCWPTITFSTADIVPNRRMFWNVRATPSAVIWSGRLVVTSLPSKITFPRLGRYSPVSMLKNVVFPAPLGPMIVAIAFCGTRNETESTAVRPPNCLVRKRVSRIAGPMSGPVASTSLAAMLMASPPSGPCAPRRPAPP